MKKYNFSFNNKLFRLGICINIFLILICGSVIFYKCVHYKNLNKEYENHKITINKNINSDVNIYYSNENSDNIYKDTGIEKMISCLKTNDDDIRNNDNINLIINDISSLFKSSNNYFSFYYHDIYSGFSLTYNENDSIWGASTIKAPLVIYIYKEAALGKINLNKYLTYNSSYYLDGTGYIQYDEVGSKYTIRELCRRAIVDSDNIAYIMLMDEVGIDNVYEYWSLKNTKVIFKDNNIWGDISSIDAFIYMNELYYFYKNNDNYGNELMSYFNDSTWKPIKSLDNKYSIANKSGWSSTIFHDTAIVFDDNPYILVILSNTGDSNYDEFFNKASQLFGQLHEYYWEYKKNKCNL